MCRSHKLYVLQDVMGRHIFAWKKSSYIVQKKKIKTNQPKKHQKMSRYVSLLFNRLLSNKYYIASSQNYTLFGAVLVVETSYTENSRTIPLSFYFIWHRTQ